MKYNIDNEIEEVLNRKEFEINHEIKGHALQEHACTKEDLIVRLYDKPKYDRNLQLSIVSRFQNEEQALQIIHDVLLKNADDIKKWRSLLYDSVYEINETFDSPIGFSISKQTDWNIEHPVCSLYMQLVEDSSRGRGFIIKTAYPYPSVLDMEEIEKARTDWAKKIKRKDH